MWLPRITTWTSTLLRPEFTKLIHAFCIFLYIEVIRVSSGTDNKGVCNVIRTRPNFRSLSFGYLPQPAHIKSMRKVITAIDRKCWNDFRFPFKMADIIDNRDNLYNYPFPFQLAQIIYFGKTKWYQHEAKRRGFVSSTDVTSSFFLFFKENQWCTWNTRIRTLLQG